MDMRIDSAVIPSLVNILVDAKQPVPDWMGGGRGGRSAGPRSGGAFERSARGGRNNGFGQGY